MVIPEQIDALRKNAERCQALANQARDPEVAAALLDAAFEMERAIRLLQGQSGNGSD